MQLLWRGFATWKDDSGGTALQEIQDTGGGGWRQGGIVVGRKYNSEMQVLECYIRVWLLYMLGYQSFAVDLRCHVSVVISSQGVEVHRRWTVGIRVPYVAVVDSYNTAPL